MPRIARAAPGGLIYHVLNRANAGLRICRGEDDYAAFERAFEEAHERVPVRVLAYGLMPDHWHLVLWPRRDGELSEFMRWLTVTHTRRWHAQHDSSGTGHLYQGRYRSFPVEPGEPLLEVIRYVESNAKREGLVRRAKDWHWSSLWRRDHGESPGGRKTAPGRLLEPSEESEGRRPIGALLDITPVAIPRNWVARVNAPFAPEVLEDLRNSVRRGAPFGSPKWRAKIIEKLGLEFTTRPRGRPRKTAAPPAEPAKPSRQPRATRSRKAASPQPPKPARHGKSG